MEENLKLRSGIVVALEAVVYCYHSVKAIGLPAQNRELAHKLYMVSNKCNELLLTMERTHKSIVLNDCSIVLEVLTNVAFEIQDNAAMFGKVKEAHDVMLELLNSDL